MNLPATVQTIEDILEALAPAETAEAFDNVGLLVGKRQNRVTKLLVALDATLDVVKEAEALGAELIVTHHPLFFSARKNMVEEDPESRIVCEMIRHDISLFCAHTNLDKTALSGSMGCAKLLELMNIRQEGFLFLGDLAEPLTASAYRKKISKALPMEARLYGNEEAIISTLAICGGAYDEGWEEARSLGAQALLTGEVKHHNALASAMSGFVLFDGGHYGTEAPLVPYLAEYLQNGLNRVQYNVRVYPSQCTPFGRV